MSCLLVVALIATNFAGTWSGKVVTDKEQGVSMTLSQDGNRITGTFGGVGLLSSLNASPTNLSPSTFSTKRKTLPGCASTVSMSPSTVDLVIVHCGWPTPPKVP